MKKIIIPTIVVLCVFLIALGITFSIRSNMLSENEVRQIKIGMTTDDLTKTLDTEPFSIEIEPNREEWYYSYHTGGFGRRNGLCVYVKDGKVIDFYSY